MKNAQLELAYNFVQYTNKNIFLTGKAGTGKTTFLRNLKKTSLKRMAIVAPTGVAAINAGGVTIHSFFQIPFGPYISERIAGSRGARNESPNGIKKFHREKINLIRSIDLLVIDEISMVRADVLDAIDEVLRRYRDRSKPFGGVQLLMIGDLHQLSPVVKTEDWQILRDFYPNLYFFSSKALQQTDPINIELKHIYRQSDTGFIDLLNCIRENRINDDVLTKLNSRYVPDFSPQDNEGYITLTTHNSTAQEINYKKLKEIAKPSSLYSASINGDFAEYNFPTDSELELKVGCQVMFVKNDPSKEKLFYNGKIGKVTRINAETVFVKCASDEMEIAVNQAEWQNIKYELNSETKEIEEKVIGSFLQHPLKLAWAITIHKSQGLTFENAIIDAGSSFAHGQVYVALSRCKSFEGVVLKSPINLNSVKTDDTVSSYTKKAEENPPGEDVLSQAKAEFQKSMLLDLFDFRAIKTGIFHCIRIFEENYNVLLPSGSERLRLIKESAEKTIYTVGETFQRELNRLMDDSSLPEENTGLQERVKKACKYFIEKLEVEIEAAIGKVSVDTDNKAVGKSIGEALNNLKKETFIKLCSLRQCGEGFNTIAYLKAKANAEIDYNNSSRSEKTEKNTLPEEIGYPELYARLRSWRNELAKENNVPVYVVLPTKALIELVSVLPATGQELIAIKGIGKQKVNRYGSEILKIITDYCDENNIERTFQAPAIEQKVKKDTKRVSLELFKAGKSIIEIARERSLTTTTIEGHLAHFISSGEISLHDLVPKTKADKIVDFLSDNPRLTLTEAKIALGEEISYGEIKAAMKHMAFLIQ